MIMQAEECAHFLERACGQHIIVIGDIMLDRFIDGIVERISPEAPVPVLSKTTMSTMPGGAAECSTQSLPTWSKLYALWPCWHG